MRVHPKVSRAAAARAHHPRQAPGAPELDPCEFGV